MRVTQEMIIQINELYSEKKNYAAVSRIVGVSPTTVKKYVNPEYCKKNDEEEKELYLDESELNVEAFNHPFWNILLVLTPGEQRNMEELRKEIAF